MALNLYYLDFENEIYFSAQENIFLSSIPKKFSSGSILLIENNGKKIPFLSPKSDIHIFYVHLEKSLKGITSEKIFSKIILEYYNRINLRLFLAIEKSGINYL
jgi:hypothetical protein